MWKILIDLALEKIKTKGIKKLDINVFTALLLQADTLNEQRFIINRLKYYNVSINIKMAIRILNFVEDFEEAYTILHEFKFYDTLSEKKRKELSFLYSIVASTADNLGQVENLMSEMSSMNLKPNVHFYITLMEKQATYNDTREVLNKYILSEEWQRKRVESWKHYKTDDAMKIIYPILFLKAKNYVDISYVTNELKSINMSTKLEDYTYLYIKDSKRRTFSEKKLELIKAYGSDFVSNILNKFLDADSQNQKNNDKKGKPKKIERSVNLYERDSSKIQNLKEKYNNICSICGKVLDLGDRYYSEVHHIHPLHLQGPDIIENMIVLCPNHHALFDRGAITIDLDSNTAIYLNGQIEPLQKLKHSISKEFINFHNDNIFKKNTITENLSQNNNLTVDYEYSVVLCNNETREESIIDIGNIDNITYFQFMLLKHKKGDIINISNKNYLVMDVIKR